MGSPSDAHCIGLAQLPRKLIELTGQPAPGGYRRLYNLALDGRIPAERDEDSGRWFVREADVPTIATTLGMATPADAKKARATGPARAA